MFGVELRCRISERGLGICRIVILIAIDHAAVPRAVIVEDPVVPVIVKGLAAGFAAVGSRAGTAAGRPTDHALTEAARTFAAGTKI